MASDDRPGYFQPQQAREVARAFGAAGVEYMFIGKSGAILLGYPSATQDVDLFVKKAKENGERIVSALGDLGYDLDPKTRDEIVRGKDFVQLKTGPFDLDLIFAPDGIDSFDEAKKRMIVIDEFPIANIRDIIASKRAAGRERDLIELPLLEDFRDEFERSRRSTPKTAAEIALEKTKESDK